MVAEGSEGRIGLWDATNFRRIGEWVSGGIGPHDMKRLGDHLVVANGGIQTDPNDRTKLNIDSMRPNLSLIDAEGRLVDQVALADALHQNSIRHLALGPQGEVAFAMQWEGDPSLTVPQLGLWTPGNAPVLCPPPEAEALRMQGYAGSIAWSGDQIAITSPKGGVAMIFASTGAHLATIERPDICGVAALPLGDFLASDGAGGLSTLTTQGLVRLSQEALSWDNHLVALA